MAINSKDLEKKYCNDQDFKDKFRKLYSLAFFMDASLKIKYYSPYADFDKLITLTPLGEKLLSSIEEMDDISKSEIFMAIFAVFGWNELFIDINKTDPNPIQEFISHEILKNNFIYPWTFGHYLYDKYFETIGKDTKQLSPEETVEFLSNTWKGVFQLGEYVTGPFGLLTSLEQRYIYPESELALYHCADPACSFVHKVQLTGYGNHVDRLIRLIYATSDAKFGNASEWLQFFRFTLKHDYFDYNNSIAFPFLLFDAFSPNELKNILKIVIEDYSKIIRDVFPKNKSYESIFIGSGEMIVEKLNHDQCAQLLLLVTDEIIIECIEKLIDRNEIKIPSTEIRHPSNFLKGYSMLEHFWEASKFGIRPRSLQFDLTILRLKDLIWQIYSDDLDDLRWILKVGENEDVSDALENYLYNEDPKNIIKKLVFYNRKNLFKTFKILKFGHYDFDHSNENFIIDKILWKLGFLINVYPEYLQLFWNRTNNFIDVAENFENQTENDKEIIRSKGLNYFISLEELLDYSLSFITYALLEDHFLNTKFDLNFDEARRFMANELNSSETDSVKFDPEKNTLYPLVNGFKVLADKCEKIIQNKEKYLRPDNEIPSYAGKTDLVKFTFMNKKIILDLNRDDVSEIIIFLKEITGILEKSGIMHIRNIFAHKREDFPSKEEILKSIEIVSELVSSMEKKGIVPMVYFSESFIIDRYARKKLIVKNYKGSTITLHLPYESTMKSKYEYNPLIIIPSLHLKTSNELLNYDLIESSDYVEMWSDYPKKNMN